MAFKDKILELLKTLPADRQVENRGSSAWLKCPVHGRGQEKTASFRIQLEEYAGSHFCFGCSIKGNWAKTCEVLGFKGPSRYVSEEYFSSSLSEDDEDFLLGRTKSEEKEFREVWPRNRKWRKIPGSLIQDIGGCLLINSNVKEPLLRLPVNVYGEERGWIDCKINPDKDEKIKYINKKGSWTKDILYPFDYVKEMDNDFLIIVEGPRDALVTIDHGFPALATLGSTSWNQKCINLITSISPKTLVLMLDPDDAGEKLRLKIKQDFKDKIEIVSILLKHEFVYRNSKQVMRKLEDPANLTEARLTKILTKAKVL